MVGFANYVGSPEDVPVGSQGLAQLLSRIHDATDRVGRVRNCASDLADRVCGADCAGSASKGADGPKDPGVLPLLFLAVDTLHARISEAETELQRLLVL